MSKKPLGKDKFGVQKVMRVKDYFGDATGQFALNAMSTLVGQLTYFYTDKVGMAAGAIATMFIVCKIIDAFTDLIMGNIIDHTKTGKRKISSVAFESGNSGRYCNGSDVYGAENRRYGTDYLRDNNEHSSDSSIIYGNGNPL